ncbi:MAG: STAS/SEC14 domain-containing protein [Solirubrobacterales bacterium]
MVERIEDMPAGTIGFRASGEVTREDYRGVLEPALQEAVEAGDVRMLYVVETGFKMDAGAFREDARTGLEIGLRHHSAWKRTALVTDVEWVKAGVRLFAFMAPGEVRVWGMDGLAEAREWVAG